MIKGDFFMNSSSKVKTHQAFLSCQWTVPSKYSMLTPSGLMSLYATMNEMHLLY